MHAGAHEIVVAFGGNVVVVEIERSLRDPHVASEGVELIKRDVGHQVSPYGPVARPQRGIDEHGHRSAEYVVAHTLPLIAHVDPVGA